MVLMYLAPPRRCRNARVYGHTTTAMHEMSTPPPLPSSLHTPNDITARLTNSPPPLLHPAQLLQTLFHTKTYPHTTVSTIKSAPLLVALTCHDAQPAGAHQPAYHMKHTPPPSIRKGGRRGGGALCPQTRVRVYYLGAETRRRRHAMQQI